MTAPIGMTQPGESLQRARRGWTDEFTDDHGRKFAAQYELANGRPIGELQPVGFAPPWLPPMRFIVWERPGGFRFRWDYATMANELAEQADAFYTEVVQFMLEHMRDERVPEVGEPIPAKALRFVGKPPLSPAIPLAAEAGDPWILGEPAAVDTLNLKDVLAQTVNANGREALKLIRERTNAKLGARTRPCRRSRRKPMCRSGSALDRRCGPHADRQGDVPRVRGRRHEVRDVDGRVLGGVGRSQARTRAEKAA
jgi:hypothetical protein